MYPRPPQGPHCHYETLAQSPRYEPFPGPGSPALDVLVQPNASTPDTVNFVGSVKARREIERKWPELVAKARAKGMRPAVLPNGKLEQITIPAFGSIRLLGSSQKVEKGLTYGVVTAILYLSPANEAWTQQHIRKKEVSLLQAESRRSGVPPRALPVAARFKPLCPNATIECMNACLGHAAGQLAMPSGLNSRLWKTILYMTDRRLFEALLVSELAAFKKAARKKFPGKTVAVRLDGSSDTGMGVRFAHHHPDIVFYDYTKNFERVMAWLGGAFPPNVHLTFSFSGHNRDQSLEVLRRGGNVAVVFDSAPARGYCEPLPRFWHRFPVIDADLSDIRFEDPPGTVAGLRFKQAYERYQALQKAGPFVEKVPGRVKSFGPYDTKAAAWKKAKELRAEDPTWIVVMRQEKSLAKKRTRKKRRGKGKETFYAGGWFVDRKAPRRQMIPGEEKNPLVAGNPLLAVVGMNRPWTRRSPKQVAGAGTPGRVKTRGKKKARRKASKKKPSKVKKNRVASKGKKKPRLKKKSLSVSAGADRFEGYEEARKVYDEFHGPDHPPARIDVYEFDDGLDEVRVEPIQVALHRTLETNYLVPWSSNKRGTLWLHEHKEGSGLRGLQKGAPMPNPEDLPLEVYDPWTQTTRKFGGRFQIRDWWYD